MGGLRAADRPGCRRSGTTGGGKGSRWILFADGLSPLRLQRLPGTPLVGRGERDFVDPARRRVGRPEGADIREFAGFRCGAAALRFGNVGSDAGRFRERRIVVVVAAGSVRPGRQTGDRRALLRAAACLRVVGPLPAAAGAGRARLTLGRGGRIRRGGRGRFRHIAGISRCQHNPGAPQRIPHCREDRDAARAEDAPDCAVDAIHARNLERKSHARRETRSAPPGRVGCFVRQIDHLPVTHAELPVTQQARIRTAPGIAETSTGRAADRRCATSSPSLSPLGPAGDAARPGNPAPGDSSFPDRPRREGSILRRAIWIRFRRSVQPPVDLPKTVAIRNPDVLRNFGDSRTVVHAA